MKREIKRPSSIVLALVLMFVTVLNSIPVTSKASGTGTYNEKTFADIGMDGDIENAAFNTNLTTWDKVALTGKVTFGEAEWDTVLVIGGIGTQDWLGIQLVPMNDGFYIASSMCDSTGTIGYTMKVGDSTDLLISNDAFGGESLLGQTVKLRLTFDYIETGIKMGITINDNHIQDVILGASVEDETVTAKDVIGSYVLGYNISVSSEKKENEPIEYTEKTFADIGMDGTIANSVFNTNLTTWDKVALTGEVTFGSAEWDTVLVIGGIGTEDWYGINIVPMNDGLYINSTMCDSTGTTGYTITIGDSTELLIGNDAFGGKSLLGKTAKMRLTFEYTETGIKMGITINDNFIQDVNLGASVEDDQVSAKDVIGSYVLGYNISVASKKTDGDDNKPGDSGQGEPVEYTELTFDDIGMQGFISSSVYNTKLSTWDKVALIGELTFGEVEWDTALVIGGIGTQDWIGIQIVPMNDGLYIVGPMSDTNGTGYTITIDDGTELLIKNDVIGGESLLGKTVKLRLTFEYTDTGIKMGVTINDKFVQDVNFGKALEDNSVNAKDIIGTYVLGYNITLLSKGTEEDENNQTPEELGYKEITINSFSLPYNATYAPGQNEENHRVATYVGSSLDMTYLNTDITFGAEQGEQYINYASADGWRGINIRVKGGALHFSNADTGTGVAYTAEELGLTSLMETFNLKLAVDMGTFSKCNHWSGEILPQCDEIKVCIWINDKMIAKDIVFNDVVMAGNGIGIYTLDHKITLGTPIAARVGIDFSLFGYTKQWKNEIKAK